MISNLRTTSEYHHELQLEFNIFIYCVGVRVPVGAEARNGTGCPALSFPILLRRQGFSLTLLLSWWPASPRKPSHLQCQQCDAGVTGAPCHVRLFTRVMRIWTQVLHTCAVSTRTCRAISPPSRTTSLFVKWRKRGGGQNKPNLKSVYFF